MLAIKTPTKPSVWSFFQKHEEIKVIASIWMNLLLKLFPLLIAYWSQAKAIKQIVMSLTLGPLIKKITSSDHNELSTYWSRKIDLHQPSIQYHCTYSGALLFTWNGEKYLIVAF